MATKDCDLPFGYNSKNFNGSSPNHDGRYSNFSLNKTGASTVDSVQSTSISNHSGRKVGENAVSFNVADFTGNESNKLKTQSDNNSWHKNDKNEYSTPFDTVNQELNKRGKKDTTSSANNSTLSLHIVNYENTIEESDKLPPKKKSENASKNVKDILTGSFSPTLFEIPRQQTDKQSEPEIMQFKASQTLFRLHENLPLKQSFAGKSMSNEIIPAPGCQLRACLGRTAQIGDIYDVRSEKLLAGINIFTEKLPNDLITVTSVPSISCKYMTSSKLSDKFAALNINGEISISLLAGLIEGSGSIRYIVEKESAQCSFIQRIRTFVERIDINSPELKGLIASNVNEFVGTHVVVGISWGGNSVASFPYDETIMNAENRLEIICDKFKKLNLKDFGSDKADEYTTDNDFANQIPLKVYADIDPLQLPSNLKEANEYFNTMAENYTTVKGVQLQLHLLPLNVVQKVFGFQDCSNQVFVNIEIPIIKRLLEFFDTTFESFIMFKNLVKFVSNNEEHIPAEDKNQIQSFANNFESDVTRMCNDLGALVQKVRSGEADAYEIDVLRKMFENNSKVSPSNISTFVDSYKYFFEKLVFVNECKQNGILMVTEAAQSAKIKQENQDTEIFILLYSFKHDTVLPTWEENFDLFYDLQNQLSETCLFAVVDTDILPDFAKNELLPDGIRIVQCFNGQYITDDYLELQKKIDSQCLVACNEMYQNDEINIRAVPINFPCPRCFNGPKEWFCAKCRHEIKYDFDGNFCCCCGFNSADEFSFKCVDPSHGDGYAKFTSADLRAVIKNLKPLQEVNILVIGETGVGKSTWINALANYISHDTINEVLKNEVINLIPTQFELTENKDGQLFQKSIKVGTSENENFTEGQSSTQQTRAYTFQHNNCLYRIIDTPGIGDSRGIEQDKANMENIMQFISSYKEIHGICVLMKPNESRITPSFEFCFKELLVQFHRSAIENIVFCFTQTSGFNFEVGQTLTPLTVLLDEIEQKQHISIPKSKERMYAFDNMAYRYLCAVKHYDSEFPPDQQELYKRSYNISRDVSRRMLNYFVNRKAHNVEESMSICRARNIIRRLTHPMAMINAAMEETLEKVKNKEKLIKRFIGDEEELRKILIKRIPFKRWYIEVLNQRYCGSCTTSEYYYGDDRLQFAEAYPAVMDADPFHMITPTHYLKNKKDKCPKCGPNTKSVFESKWFNSETGTREEEDTTVAGQMKEKLKTREGIEEEIKRVEQFKAELTAENDLIVKASARFAHFLSRYSITPYNDATEKYLKMLIRKEELMGTESKKMLYENLLSQYDAEKMALEKQLKNASNIEEVNIKTSDIMKIVEDLKKLKHYGRDIAKAIGECNKAILREASGEEMEISLPNQKMSKFNTFCSWAWKMVKRN